RGFFILAPPPAAPSGLLPDGWRARPRSAAGAGGGSTKAATARGAGARPRERPLPVLGRPPPAGGGGSGEAGASPRPVQKGALVILTPTETSPPPAVQRVGEFWQALGARVTTLDPVTHDRAVAAVSHLPHLVADALVETVLRMDPRFLEVAAGGFRDTTRI